MIRVVYAILAVAIKDLKVHYGNANLPLGKSKIRFEPLAQKGVTNKQIADALYYKYLESISQGPMLVLKKHEPKLPFCIKIRLLQFSENKLSSRRFGG